MAFVGFASKIAVIEPFPFPEGVTMHHAASLEEVQLEFEVTEKVVVPDAAVTALFEGDTDNVGARSAAVNVATMPIDACGVHT